MGDRSSFITCKGIKVQDSHNHMSSKSKSSRPTSGIKDTPTQVQLNEWKESMYEKDKDEAFTPEWYLSSSIGFYLFSSYLKKKHNDHHRINFIEYSCLFRQFRGPKRCRIAHKIVRCYLSKESNTDLSTKKDLDLSEGANIRRNSTTKFTPDEIETLFTELYDPICGENCCVVGLFGNKVYNCIEYVNSIPLETDLSPMSWIWKSLEISPSPLSWMWNALDINSSQLSSNVKMDEKLVSEELPTALFDELEVVVFESLKKQYWGDFLKSEEYERANNLLWYVDRKVVKGDFCEMRLLGRGGYGLVTVCKRLASGKLYAMKAMDKKRIKSRHAERFAINERRALVAVNSPFVIGLNFSLQTESTIYLILDLMTGGDLEYHLKQKGSFSEKETLYYAAQIMLGIQAIHEIGCVYRDLKPGNCLLDRSGRVKITDLGLVCKVHPKLVGAAGTQGYWAPDMLIRDEEGNRVPYNHAVDWFSFGCVLAEFISGINPFLTVKAFKFGVSRGAPKEKAINYAIMEMEPPFDPFSFTTSALDLCRKLLDKNPETRLGVKGCEFIKCHSYFESLDWDLIIHDKVTPPFQPSQKVNNASESDIGQFSDKNDEKLLKTVLNDNDQTMYEDWDYVNSQAQINDVLQSLSLEKKVEKKGCW